MNDIELVKNLPVYTKFHHILMFCIVKKIVSVISVNYFFANVHKIYFMSFQFYTKVK